MSDEPEIIVKELAPASGDRLRFLILATDGCECLYPVGPNDSLISSLGRHDRRGSSDAQGCARGPTPPR